MTTTPTPGVYSQFAFRKNKKANKSFAQSELFA